MHRFWFIQLLLPLLLLLTTPTLADTPIDKQQVEQTRKKLETARKEIDELQKLLRKIEREKSALHKQLQHTETDMSALEEQIRELKKQIQADESALMQLDKDQNRLEQSYHLQQQRIARHSRAIWQSGGQSAPLRLLLSGQQPAELSRNLTYYRYLGQARQQEIHTLNTTLVELNEARQQTLERKNQLDEQQQALDANHRQLVVLHNERQMLLASLSQQQKDRSAKLKTSQQQSSELARVLQKLETSLEQQAKAEEKARAEEKTRLQAEQTAQQHYGEIKNTSVDNFVQNSPFAQTRGKLPWPIDGRLLARYGSPRSGDTRIKWDGVLIGAPEGSVVRAIHPGQVVLANYLSGMGLMLIINHGNNYLSLYGHNQSLLKKVGDLVQTGEPIATVGKSGGQAEPALYFAIRHRKTPNDPANWCIAQNQLPH